MKGITMDQFQETAPGEPSGEFCTFRGEMWYRISSYDAIPPFFMTIVSSSDVWNYLWSNGGITAGRINCDNAVFPYCTADKVSDNRYNTGSYTALRVYQDGKVYLGNPSRTRLTDYGRFRGISIKTPAAPVWFLKK